MLTVDVLRFHVYGKPQQQGSKRAFLLKTANGPRAMMREDNEKLEPWYNAVAREAARAMNGAPLLSGPIRLTVQFFFPRPKSHYGSGRNATALKPKAPTFHAQKPDLGKLLRSVEDACTGVVWMDDSQISHYGHGTAKLWTREQAGAEIVVESLAMFSAAETELALAPLGLFGE